MVTYTLVYQCVATNLSKADLVSAWQSINPDPRPVQQLGLTLASDNTVISFGSSVLRTIVYTHPSDNKLAPDLENLNTIIFRKGLKTQLRAAAVVVT